MVARLRAMTSAGLLQCKKALVESGGALNAAVDVLRKKGVASAANMSAREARDGIIVHHIQPGSKRGVLVEVNCQTDFVARNETFRAFCEEAARRLAADANADLEADRIAVVAKTGENVRISRCERYEVEGHGTVAAYIHTGGKVGVLVEVGAEKDTTTASDEFRQLVKEITLQVAAAHPTVVSRDRVPADVLAKEKEIAAEQFKDKPPQAIAKIVEGKLEKFYQTCCLVDQALVTRNSEISVKDHVAAVGKSLGDQIVIRRFVRYQVGEALD